MSRILSTGGRVPGLVRGGVYLVWSGGGLFPGESGPGGSLIFFLRGSSGPEGSLIFGGSLIFLGVSNFGGSLIFRGGGG